VSPTTRLDVTRTAKIQQTDLMKMRWIRRIARNSYSKKQQQKQES